MASLLQRFARVVLAKLRKLVDDYTLVRREDVAGETAMQEAARRALVWALRRVCDALDRFPYLHPEVAARARFDLNHLASDLFATHPNGGFAR